MSLLFKKFSDRINVSINVCPEVLQHWVNLNLFSVAWLFHHSCDKIRLHQLKHRQEFMDLDLEPFVFIWPKTLQRFTSTFAFSRPFQITKSPFGIPHMLLVLNGGQHLLIIQRHHTLMTLHSRFRKIPSILTVHT